MEDREINEQSESTIWLRGDRVGLGPFSGDLVDQYWKWEQDPAVLVGYGRQTPDSIENRREGFKHQARGTNTQLRFTIYDLSTSTPTPVGTASILIDHAVRTGEFIIQIGESANRGRGIGTEATRLTLDYAFHVTNLKCVYLSVLANNTRAIASYERAGFRKIGERRNSGYWLGQRINEVLMDALPEDFAGPSVVAQLVNEQP